MSREMFLAQTRRRGLLNRHVCNRRAIYTHQPSREAYDRMSSQIGSGFIFVLCGPRGSGKTQIATSLACEEMDRMTPLWKTYREDHWPMYTTARNVFTEIRATYDPDSELNEVQILKRFSEPHLLILDEAQERGNTEWEDKTLTDIIDRRYGLQHDTIIISNLTRGELPKAFGPSIISRLHECGDVIECNWPSFREV